MVACFDNRTICQQSEEQHRHNAPRPRSRGRGEIPQFHTTTWKPQCRFARMALQCVPCRLQFTPTRKYRSTFMRTFGLALVFGALACTAMAASAGGDLAEQFRRPPDSARPWVYCFWLEGNVTREGITADLEAMRRAGIGGLLFMDGNMGNPVGPHRFMSDSWRAMFRHMVVGGRSAGAGDQSEQRPRLGRQRRAVDQAGTGGPKSRDVGDDRARPGALRRRVGRNRRRRATSIATSSCWPVRRLRRRSPASSAASKISTRRNRLPAARILPDACLGRVRFPRIRTGRSFPRSSASPRPRFKT